MALMGQTVAPDTVRARVRVQAGPITTGWLPFATMRAGEDRTWHPPEPGEQVLLVAPGGDLNQGVVVGSIYRAAHPAPADSANVSRTLFKDGAVMEYDRAQHHWRLASRPAARSCLRLVRPPPHCAMTARPSPHRNSSGRCHGEHFYRHQAGQEVIDLPQGAGGQRRGRRRREYRRRHSGQRQCVGDGRHPRRWRQLESRALSFAGSGEAPGHLPNANEENFMHGINAQTGQPPLRHRPPAPKPPRHPHHPHRHPRHAPCTTCHS